MAASRSACGERGGALTRRGEQGIHGGDPGLPRLRRGELAAVAQHLPEGGTVDRKTGGDETVALVRGERGEEIGERLAEGGTTLGRAMRRVTGVRRRGDRGARELGVLLELVEEGAERREDLRLRARPACPGYITETLPSRQRQVRARREVTIYGARGDTCTLGHGLVREWRGGLFPHHAEGRVEYRLVRRLALSLAR